MHLTLWWYCLILTHFIRSRALLKPKDTYYWLENPFTLVHWYHETHDAEHQLGFLIQMQYWRIHYYEEMQRFLTQKKKKKKI